MVTGASGRNRATGGSMIRATSNGDGARTRRTFGERDDRRHVEVADRDPHPIEHAHDANAGGIGVKGDLLVRLAQGGRGGIGVVRLRTCRLGS